MHTTVRGWVRKTTLKNMIFFLLSEPVEKGKGVPGGGKSLISHKFVMVDWEGRVGKRGSV